MSKPPVVSSQPRDLAAGIARLRAATGKAERRVMIRVCSKEGKPYSTAFERLDPREKFKIAAIEKITEAGGGQGRRGQPGQAAEAFSAEEFDQKGIRCAWCGDQSGSVHHDKCDTTYCGAAWSQKSDGTKTFRCPTCNETFETVSASTLTGRLKEQAASGLLAASRGLLGGKSTPLLEGKKTSLLPKWRK